MLRKLDGISHQIDEHLAQPHRVGHHSNAPNRSLVHEGNGLVFNEPHGHGPNIFQNAHGFHFLQVQFHLPGVDFGKIQDRIDEYQQVLPVLENDLHVLLDFG